jgi:hypothetical protein
VDFCIFEENQYLCDIENNFNYLEGKIMTVAQEKKEMRKKSKELSNEAIAVLLERAGITKNDIYNVALKNWVAKNLDLFTPLERQKYNQIILNR